MNLLLIILKYAGTAISGAAGIWGTVSETHDKKTGKLSPWGKWALGFAIAGFVVALGSQIAEQIIAKNDAAENKDRAEKTEKQLNEQLNATQLQLARVNSRFEGISGQLSFEISSKGPGVTSFLGFVQPMFKDLPPDTPKTGAYNFRFRYDTLAKDGLKTDEARLFSFLKTPIIWFGLYAKGTQAGATNEANFTVPILNATPGDSIGYDCEKRTLSFYWSFDCPKERTITDLQITSIPDLDGARLRLIIGTISEQAEQIVSASRVVAGEIRFDSTRVFVPSFERGTNGNTIYFEAILPSTEDILSWKTLKDAATRRK